MKILNTSILLLALTGCASNPWSVTKVTDEFTDKTSCRVVYGKDFGREVLRRQLGGIHYFPFVEKINGEIIFGIQNNYNIPVGDVQIRIDDNESILISYTETPVFYSATKAAVDLSYMKGVNGLDTDAMNSAMAEAMKLQSVQGRTHVTA